MDELKRQVDGAPDAPGVYLWKDDVGEVLYVGKAKSLRKRVRSYLSGHDGRDTIPLMMERAASLDYVVTKNEVEGLILESNLIKQLRPPFNVDYRDDKTYPYIALTMGDAFPAIKYTRERHRKDTRYFGPYTDAKAARETIEVARRVFPVCSERCAEWRRVARRGGEPTGKPCFDYHVGKGPGVCVGAVSPEQYAEAVAEVAAFLEGRRGGVVARLECEMREASENLDYERAARLRNSLQAVRAVFERQTVVSEKPLDADVIGISREETIAGVHLLMVREGRVLAGNEFVLDKGMDVPECELLEGFLLRYYPAASHVPREVLVPPGLQETDALDEWLSALRGSRVTVRTPQRGAKRELAELAAVNARHTLARFKHRTRYDEERTNEALLQLASALALDEPPMCIECYDISTLHGRHSVGSMVVFAGGKADSSAYRRFKVRAETSEADDTAMLAEVLRRRFARAEEPGGRFARRPDLVIVDGGKPQLSAAVRALEEAGVAIPTVALAKREEELFVPGWDEPVVLPAGSASLYLVKRIRDEAHRFAITYHRELRGRAMTASALDDIPGVGPKRKRALLRHFGSFKRLRAASAEEIALVPGVGPEVAGTIVALLRERSGDTDAEH